MKIAVHAIVCFFISLCFFEIIEATEKFYDCNVYTNEENIPTESTYCVNDILDNKFYCKSWECEALECPLDQQLPQKGDDCSICPDTCTNGGRLFNKGERIPCIDGSNKCTCISTGTVISTRRGTNKFWLCGAPVP
ncbi:uncharacterized protein LOC111122761 isoform X2 [Crassostrea virginica]|uniref:Uncharacterized protein LOC111122761 n=1 Tax=Crassostrea virginica TaxID=6565 RepID=A0A8B8CYQ7_CRAVI|nr:uncharacterized protein LOC111122761 [Crassostrea virginica]